MNQKHGKNGKQRWLAVSDENYKKEQDHYQQQLRMLKEKEMVIEHERKLLELKEGLVQREK